jgi:ABC-type sugar transport system substrate-binding protein
MIQALGIGAGASLAGCLGQIGGDDSGDGYKLGFAAMAAPSPWHRMWMRTHEWYAQDQGHEIIVANAEFEAEQQTRQVQNMLNKGVDGLIISPVSSGGSVDVVENALDEGVAVMTNNSSVFTQEIPLFVAFGNYSGGYLAGKQIAAKVNDLYGGGRLLDIMGDQTSETAQLRSQGFTDAVNEEGLTVARHIAAKWSVEKAIEKTTAFLQQDSDIQGMYGAWGAATEAMRQSLKRQDMLVERGDDGYIPMGVIDAVPVALENIRNGYLEVAVDQPMPFYGPVTIEYMTDYLEADKDESVLPSQGEKIGADQLSIEPEEEKGPEGHTNLWKRDYWAPAEVQLFSDEDTDYHPYFRMEPLAVTKENVDAEYLWAKYVDLL